MCIYKGNHICKMAYNNGNLNIEHILTKRSSAVENESPLLPNVNNMLDGELAINYANGKEVLVTKNSSGEVATFSSDNYFSEKKLGSAFTGQNSAVTVTQAINQIISLPTVSSADNGKILMVVDGAWVLSAPSMLYVGNGTPSSSQGKDGDIYIQIT